MDPPPPLNVPDSPTASPPPPLRLMCSYGGHILPRPHDKTLCYIGGDTRIIVSDRHVSLQDLTTRLSKTLFAGKPFSLKYQLPTEDLDSLISVTTDEDLENMVEEYDRLVTATSSTRNPTRIRLFLFDDSKTPSFSSLENSKSEDWFLNALNGSTPVGLSESASVNCLLGLDDVILSNNEMKEGPRKQIGGNQDVHSVPDSPILDASSSFGSTSSSPAMGNLPPIRVRVEDQKPPTPQTVAGVEDGGPFIVPAAAMVKVPGSMSDLASPNSVSSDSSLTNPLSRQRNMIYQDPSFQIQNQISLNRVSTPVDSKPSDPNLNYLFPSQFEQQFQQLNPHHQQQQPPQYIQSGSQYIPQGAVPAPAYYIVYPPQQQYPSGYVSARPSQAYNMQSSYAPSMGSSQNQQHFMGYPPIHQQSQSIAPSSIAATGNYAYEYADPVNPRMVYTQQMTPQMAVQYQNPSPVLSEASAQVPSESFNQQHRAAP